LQERPFHIHFCFDKEMMHKGKLLKMMDIHVWVSNFYNLKDYLPEHR